MNKDISIARTFYWRRPFASAYFRSAGSYLLLKLSIFIMAGLAGQYLLTHYLAREDYGLLIWVGTIIALLSPFGLPGISTSITGAVARGYDGNFRRGTWLEMVGGTVGGLVLLGFAGYHWFWTHEETKAFIFIVAGVLGPGLWLDTHQCYWNGKKNFKALFWWAVPVRLLQLIATATVLLYFSSSPLWVFIVQMVIQVTANIGAAIGIMKIGGINKETSKEYQAFGWFYTWLNLIAVISSQMDKIIIWYFFGLGNLAIFAVGELIYVHFFLTPKTILEQMYLPRLAELELKNAVKWVKKQKLYLYIGMVFLLIILYLNLPYLYKAIFSTRYNESIFYANLFLLNIMFGTPTLLVGALVKAHRMKHQSAIAVSIVSIIPLILIYPSVMFFGLKGIIFMKIFINITLSSYYYITTERIIKGT